MSTSITDDNYKNLFSFAVNRIDLLYDYYPIVSADFNKHLSEVEDIYRAYTADLIADDDFIKVLSDRFSISKMPNNDVANRQIIYTLADVYFMTSIWYNIFKLVTGFKDVDSAKIGKANSKLADYLRNLINRYNTGSSIYKQDSRDVGKEIGMSWITYEELVKESLAYTDNFNIKQYRKLVNIALLDKLGLSSIYM